MEPKTFRRRELRARATRTAVEEFTGPVLEHLRERMRAVGFEGELSPRCFAELQETLTGFVETSLAHLRASIDEREAPHYAAPELRTRRDACVQDLYSTLVALRHTVRGVFGTSAEGELFGTGKTPRDPVALTRLGHALVDRLSQSETRESLSNGRVSFDWDVTTAGLVEKTVRLEEVLCELTRNTRRQSTAVAMKDEAAREHDRTQRGLFKVLEGLYEMAGMDTLARKLRPTEPARRRPTDTSDVEEPIESTASVLPKPRSPRPVGATGSHRSEPRPELRPSASLRGIRPSAPPGAATPPGSPDSAPLAVSTHPVRTGSDPPGGASHPGSRSSSPPGGGLPVV